MLETNLLGRRIRIDGLPYEIDVVRSTWFGLMIGAHPVAGGPFVELAATDRRISFGILEPSALRVYPEEDHQ